MSRITSEQRETIVRKAVAERDALLAGATPEREPEPGQVWKLGDEFLAFHPSASHVPPDYRDGWNRCYSMAVKRAASQLQAAIAAEREACAAACEVIEMERWDAYKNPRSIHAGSDLIQGQSDGATLCAAAIRSRGDAP